MFDRDKNCFQVCSGYVSKLKLCTVIICIENSTACCIQGVYLLILRLFVNILRKLEIIFVFDCKPLGMSKVKNRNKWEMYLSLRSLMLTLTLQLTFCFMVCQKLNVAKLRPKTINRPSSLNCSSVMPW